MSMPAYHLLLSAAYVWVLIGDLEMTATHVTFLWNLHSKMKYCLHYYLKPYQTIYWPNSMCSASTEREII